MKKKRGILAMVFLLFVLAAGVWIYSRPEKTVAVKGNLSEQDVKEIKRAVRKTMRVEVFPRFSWLNVKALPMRSVNYIREDVRSVQLTRRNFVVVGIATSSHTNSFPVADAYYSAVKGTNGWKAHHMSSYYDFDIY